MTMLTITPQERIDKLIETMFWTQKLKHQELSELLFAIIDRYCGQSPGRCGPGRRQTYSDATIVKLDMLMHLTGKRGETEILREARRHYQGHFAALPGQSRLWHRIRQALPLLERFRWYLRIELGVGLADMRILDTCPIPVAYPNSRPGRGNGFNLAEGGYCASKKLKYLGFKLGMLMTPQGIPDVYDLFSARPHDSRILNSLLAEVYNLIACGDKGFVGDLRRKRLGQEQNVWLITYRRRNQKHQNTSLEQWALHTYRQLIETVFSQLDGHMHLQETGAKTDLGLVKRVVGIMTAFTLGIYLNFLLGRKLLAIKELFA